MKVLAFDANSIVNRAFYGVRLLSTREGTYTNAVYGFFNIVYKLIEEQKPDAVAFAFDLHAPTFRHKMYEQYKGTRKGMPEELRQQVKKHAEELGGEESGFYYGMVARYTYGDADNRTCRFDIARQPSGLWTACFHYDGETPFQSEDWLYLHEHAGRVPMLAIHACADFAADKGMTVFTGGQTLDEWSQMAEIWFWLMEQYEIGNPPEEAVQHLKKLEGIMRQSDFDMTIPELLRGCIDHLNDVMAHTNQPDELRRLMDECAERKDYQGLFVVQCQVAETVLWDCTHVDLWLANLESILREWQKENPA